MRRFRYLLLALCLVMPALFYAQGGTPPVARNVVVTTQEGVAKTGTLLATDADGSLRRAFGVAKTLGLIPGRVTFVIDRQGVVRHVFSGQFVADRHVREALDAVRTLASAAT